MTPRWARLHAAQCGPPVGIVLLEDRDINANNREQLELLLANATSRAEPPRHESKYHCDNTPHRGANEARLHRLYETPASENSLNTVPFLFGAIRPGGIVDLSSSRHVGLPLNWAIIGFFDAAVAAILYPLLCVYLGCSGEQLNAVHALFSVPRLFKFFVGYLSDCFPIHRQRRKPYMIIGWIVLMIFMGAIVFFKHPTPYMLDGVVANSDADIQGLRYVMMMLAGMFGHLLCTVACEGMMIEFSHREGEYGRGRVQCLCVLSRFAGEALGGISTSLALNSAEFGGSFAAAVPLRVVFATYVLFAATGLAVTMFFVTDEKTPMSTQRVSTQLRRTWDNLQKPVVWHITVVGFFIFAGMYFRPFELTQGYRDWLGASSLTIQAISVMTSLGKSVGAAIWLMFLLNANWRKTVLLANAVVLLVAVPVEIMIVHDVYRSLAATLIKHQVGALFDGFTFIVYILVAVEVAEPGYEAVTYGIVTTVGNLGVVITAVCKNLLTYAPRRLTPEIAEIRNHVQNLLLVKYALRVATMVVVWLLLPRQKRELRLRSLHSAPNLVVPLVLFSVFALLLVVSVTSDLLAVFPSTWCLAIAGGRGC